MKDKTFIVGKKEKHYKAFNMIIQDKSDKNKIISKSFTFIDIKRKYDADTLIVKLQRYLSRTQ
jgi:hypothetical protein